MAKVSVLIPSRNELFLPQTVREVLTKARGDVECIVNLDGYWPDPPLPPDPRLHIVHRGDAQGMRQGINATAAIARGDFLMKLDAHCMLDEGYDVKLAADCDQDWVVVPRRYALEADVWVRNDSKQPIDAHYLSYPLANPEDKHCGLHGTVWKARAQATFDVLVADEMSSQGSCWFTSRRQWERFGPLDHASYGPFVQEFQEIGCKTWLGGGQVKVNKKTWYAHLHKGKKYGRMYSMGSAQVAKGEAYCKRHWMVEEAAGLRRLVEKFWPVPSWPEDLDEAFARARKAYGG